MITLSLFAPLESAAEVPLQPTPVENRYWIQTQFQELIDSKPEDAISETAKYFFAPFFLMATPLSPLLGTDLSESYKDRSKHLIGYVIIGESLSKINDVVFSIDEEIYDVEAAKFLKTKPTKVLYISSFQEYGGDRALYFGAEARYQTLKKTSSNIKHVKVSDFKSLIKMLETLPQDRSFDHIEIDLHGGPGALRFSDGSIITAADLGALEEANLRIAAPGAGLKFTACNVGATNFSGDAIGEKFMGKFGRALLPDGGRVVASQRMVLGSTDLATIDKDFEVKIARFLKRSWDQVVQVPYELAVSLDQIMRMGIRSRKNVVHVDIPPRSPCGSALSKIAGTGR